MKRLVVVLAGAAVGLGVTAVFAHDGYWFVIGAIAAGVAAVMVHVTEQSPFSR